MSYSSLFNSGLRRGIPEEVVPDDDESSVSSFVESATPQSTSGRSSPRTSFSQQAQYGGLQPPRAPALAPTPSKTQRNSPRRASWSPAVMKPNAPSYDTRSVMEYPNVASDVASIRSVRSTNRHSTASTIKGKSNLKVVTNPHMQRPPPPTGPPPSIPHRKRKELSFLSLSDSPLDVIEDDTSNSPDTVVMQYSTPTYSTSSSIFSQQNIGYSPQPHYRYDDDQLPSPSRSVASGRSSSSGKSKILQKLFSFPKSSKQKD